MKIGHVYLVAMLLLGCSPLKPYRQIAADPNVTVEKKAIISAKVSQMFPSETKYLPGKIVTVIDTIIDTDQILEMAAMIDSLLWVTDKDSLSRDSLKSVIMKAFKPAIIRKVSSKTDTTYIPDPALSASLFSCYQSLNAAEAKISQLQTLNDELTVRGAGHKKRERKGWIWFGGLLLAVIIGVVIKIFK